MKDYKSEHELLRRKVWAEAWASTASAGNCTSKAVATAWADTALKEFDARFPMMEEPA